MSFPPSFQTARLSFVPINADEHAESVFAIRRRADVMKYSLKRTPDTTIQETHAWLSNFNHFNQPTNTSSSGDTNLESVSPIGYVVCEASSPPSTSSSNPSTTEPNGVNGPKRIIGTSGLRLGVSPTSSSSSLNPSLEQKRWEIGYGFDPSAWGRGIATEVVKGWIRQIQVEGLLDGIPGYNGGAVRKVLAACTDSGNEASRRVLEKCGFVFVGEFVDELGRANFEFEFGL